MPKIRRAALEKSYKNFYFIEEILESDNLPVLQDGRFKR